MGFAWKNQLPDWGRFGVDVEELLPASHLVVLRRGDGRILKRLSGVVSAARAIDGIIGGARGEISLLLVSFVFVFSPLCVFVSVEVEEEHNGSSG